MANQDRHKLTRVSSEQIEARQDLLANFKDSPIPDDEILTNLGLYLRSTILAKMLYLNELYEKILNIPGIVMEFGAWWGANLALLGSFRSVYEPYNQSRKVVGFDTFRGYPSVSPEDGASPHVAVGGYAVPEGYEDVLSRILDAHERDNVLSHIRKYEIVKGDVAETIHHYLDENPQTMIALAYFDLQLYEPTKRCLEAIQPYLIRGSVLAMDELNAEDFPGETIALKEVLGLSKYRVYRSRFLPDRSYVVLD
ncbi:MAG: crotonobetainyl-CoA--carnitine CoA-transferase [Anaerolineales bacterium]